MQSRFRDVAAVNGAEHVTTKAPSGTQPSGPSYPLLFAVIAAGVAMANLDTFIVNVALPQIGTAMDGAQLSSLSWVPNVYAIVFAAGLIPAGIVADARGAKATYMAGLFLFAASSAGAAAAPALWLLIAARVAQAVGAAMIIPSSLGLLLAAVAPQRRAASVRMWAAIGGLAAAVGPIAGGLLTEIDWRWIFLINLPVALFAITAGRFVLPATMPRAQRAAFDLIGAVTLAGSVTLLALGLVKGNDWGWSSPATLTSLGLALVGVVLLVFRCKTHPTPVISPEILRIDGVATATVANFLFAIAFGAMLLSAVLWCQQVWHWTPLRTGLAIAPGPAMVPVLAVAVGPAVRRFGSGRVAAAGAVTFSIGLGWWAATLVISPNYVADLLPGMLLTGLGVGMTVPTLVGAAVTVLPPTAFATGSALVTMARQIGAALGVALLVVVLDSSSPGNVVDAFVKGWHVTIAITVLAAISCLLIRQPIPARRSDARTHHSAS